MIATQGLLAFIACLVILLVVVAIAVRGIRNVDLTEPDPETPRPEPEEPVDFAEALKACGGPPPWEENRK